MTETTTATTAASGIEIFVDSNRGPFAKVGTKDGPYWVSLRPFLGLRFPEQAAFEQRRRAAQIAKETFSESPPEGLNLPFRMRDRFFKLRRQPSLRIGRETHMWSGYNVLLGPGAKAAAMYTFPAEWVPDEGIGQMQVVIAASCVPKLGGAFAATFGQELSVAFFTSAEAKEGDPTVRNLDEENWQPLASGKWGALRPVRSQYKKHTVAPAVWSKGSPEGAAGLVTVNQPALNFIGEDGKLGVQPIAPLFAPDGNVGDDPRPWLLFDKSAKATLGSTDPNTREITLPGSSTQLLVKRRKDGDLWRIEVSVSEGMMLPHLGVEFGGWFGRLTFSDVRFSSRDGFHWWYDSFTSRFKGKKPKHRHDDLVEEATDLKVQQVVEDETADPNAPDGQPESVENTNTGAAPAATA